MDNYYILLTFLLVLVLLLEIDIICYYFIKDRLKHHSKQKWKLSF